MNKHTAGQNEKSGNGQKSTQKSDKHGVATIESIESLLPTGSWQRVAAGVAAAAGGGLLAAAMVGVGPAALAGAAGYLAYRGLGGQKKKNETGPIGHKH